MNIISNLSQLLHNDTLIFTYPYPNSQDLPQFVSARRFGEIEQSGVTIADIISNLPPYTLKVREDLRNRLLVTMGLANEIRKA